MRCHSLRFRPALLPVLVAATLTLPAAAQQPVVPPAPEPPAATPADVASPEAIIGALYDVISGPAGGRDWDRFRSLFAPGARLIPIGRAKSGGFAATAHGVEEYITRADAFFRSEGFFEREIARREERFGQLVQAFSTYESRKTPEAAPFSRGINSIQLYDDGTRWWVMTIMWDSEREGNPIPEEYLRTGQ